MTVDAPSPSAGADLDYARQIVRLEGQALIDLAERFDHRFVRAVELVARCAGSVIVSGMGKAGLIGQKIAATLASTGTRSHFLHPGEAVHGDLGRVHATDAVLLLSQSGETKEVVTLLPSLGGLGAPTIAITKSAASTLGRFATEVIELGPLQEACSLGLAPSTSTTAMLSVGDALALVASRKRGFGRADFARFHPGGSLGRALSKVESCMRSLGECRLVPPSATVREVFASGRNAGRRTGATMVVDGRGVLIGIFTDSDLARLFERRQDAALDHPIAHVMTRSACKVPAGAMLTDALSIMAERKISELPVVDAEGRPVGMLDITDVGIEWVKDVAPPPVAHVVPSPNFSMKTWIGTHAPIQSPG